MSAVFERLSARMERKAARRAAVRAQAIAERLGSALPAGIEAAAEAEGVVLSGRGLAGRFAREAALRWRIEGGWR